MAAGNQNSIRWITLTFNDFAGMVHIRVTSVVEFPSAILTREIFSIHFIWIDAAQKRAILIFPKMLKSKSLENWNFCNVKTQRKLFKNQFLAGISE